MACSWSSHFKPGNLPLLIIRTSQSLILSGRSVSMGSTSGRGILRGEEPGEKTRPFVGVTGVELTRDCGGDPVSEEGAIVIIATRK